MRDCCTAHVRSVNISKFTQYCLGWTYNTRFSFEQLWFCSQKIIYRKEHRSDVILVLLLFMNDEAFFLVEIDFWSSLIPPRTIYLCTQLHWQFLTMRLIGSYFIQQISNLFMSLNIRLQILNVKL